MVAHGVVKVGIRTETEEVRWARRVFRGGGGLRSRQEQEAWWLHFDVHDLKARNGLESLMRKSKLSLVNFIWHL